MSAAPPVTVITSTYNWPRALAQAIPTALAQDFGDFEYLIIGDACTDETEDVVRSFKDERIIWRNLKQNTGNQSGVNKLALEAARGEYIAYLNHDDLWFPDHLGAVLEPLRDGALDVVNALCLAIAPGGHHFRGLIGLPHVAGRGLLDINPMTTSVMHTARAARECGGWIDWRETKEVPTQDFFRRLRHLRGRFAIASHITSLKFHSGDRIGSYTAKDASEQEHWAARMRDEPNLRYGEAMIAMACQAMGEVPPRVAAQKQPDNAPPGWQIEQWRRARGLTPMIDLGETAPREFHLEQPPQSFIRAHDGKALISSLPAPLAKWPAR